MGRVRGHGQVARRRSRLALVSARLRGTQGGGANRACRVSPAPAVLPSRADRGSARADFPRMHARLLWGKRRGVGALAVAS